MVQIHATFLWHMVWAQPMSDSDVIQVQQNLDTVFLGVSGIVFQSELKFYR